MNVGLAKGVAERALSRASRAKLAFVIVIRDPARVRYAAFPGFTSALVGFDLGLVIHYRDGILTLRSGRRAIRHGQDGTEEYGKYLRQEKYQELHGGADCGGEYRKGSARRQEGPAWKESG